MRILVVDDSVDSLTLMKIELEHLGHSVVTAEDGSTALAMALADPPDLIISDIRLPEMDGFDLVRRIRREPRLHLIHAIAVTGLSTPEELAQIRRAGFSTWLIKPVEFSRLAAEIEVIGKKVKSTSGS